jgi:hypothetical protein
MASIITGESLLHRCRFVLAAHFDHSIIRKHASGLFFSIYLDVPIVIRFNITAGFVSAVNLFSMPFEMDPLQPFLVGVRVHYVNKNEYT